MKKQISLLLAMLLLVTIVAGCNSGQTDVSQSPATGDQTDNVESGAFPVTVTDTLGREVTVEAEPQKVISLSPAITEILFAIGVGDKIVGVTEYCDYPAAALEKPKVGTFQEPNVELIINSEPDVVFVAAGIQSDFVQQFEDLGIKVITLDAETVEQVLYNIELAGLVTGAQDKAARVVDGLEQRVKAVQAKIAQTKTKPTVFFEVWDDPLMTAGPGSFVNDLIELAGGQNIAADAVKRYSEFSQELLIERNPDIYILNSHAHDPEDVKKRPGYAGLAAVQNDQVYTVEDDLVTLPGPRLIDGLEIMARIIHPEVF